jgi:hypothetical protein
MSTLRGRVPLVELASANFHRQSAAAWGRVRRSSSSCVHRWLPRSGYGTTGPKRCPSETVSRGAVERRNPAPRPAGQAQGGNRLWQVLLRRGKLDLASPPSGCATSRASARPNSVESAGSGRFGHRFQPETTLHSSPELGRMVFLSSPDRAIPFVQPPALPTGLRAKPAPGHLCKRPIAGS